MAEKTTNGITKEQAYEIAKRVDSEATVVVEYPKGWHFSRKYDEVVIGDPGFAVSREDGRVLHGFGANIFLFELDITPLGDCDTDETDDI